MPHATPVPHATFLLVVAGMLTIAVVVGTMVIARRVLRAQITGRTRDAGLDGGMGTPMRSAMGSAMGSAMSSAMSSAIVHAVSTGAGPRLSPGGPGRTDGVVRTLAERGLVAGDQLASMSPAEREFFLATVRAKLGDGARPRLMTQTHATGGATAAAAAVALDPVEDAVPHAALVSGAIHCPVCRTPIGKRTDAPLLMSRCPGCSRRVAAHVDGDRLTVTLHYTLRTPAMGVPTIKVTG
jgi:hypothetical protein